MNMHEMGPLQRLSLLGPVAWVSWGPVTLETHQLCILRAAVVRWGVVRSRVGKQPDVLEAEPEVRRSGPLCL